MPELGDIRLRRKRPEEGSAKIVYRAQKYVAGRATGERFWSTSAMMIRLEYFPRLKVWRLIKAVDVSRTPLKPRLQNTVLTEWPDITEQEAHDSALATLILWGSR